MKDIFFIALTVCIAFVASKNDIGPITADFNSFLKTNGYGSYNFARTDYLNSGSFGGKNFSTQKVNNVPVIFVHGNSDAALQVNSFSTGWTNTVKYFLDKGYTLAELYATSWGNTNANEAVLRHHDCSTLERLRKFIEAVLDYTQAPKISFITHSMGVTLTRRLILGGVVKDRHGHCELGDSLASRVNVFVGLSGANYGLCSCGGETEYLYPTCSSVDGFWPGDYCGRKAETTCGSGVLPPTCKMVSYSQYLMALNTDKSPIADKLFSAWSHDDDLIGNADYVWGNYTSLIPLSSDYKIYQGITHMQTKENTFGDQYYMITKGAIPK